MKISILLITYNHSAYIVQCIESIKMQQVDAEIEIIVADDCSTDDTAQKIRQTLQNVVYPVLYLDSAINLGFVKNYQRGFASCTGAYIAVMEGDDYWTSPQRLQIHVNFLELHRECVAAMNRYITFIQSELRYQVSDWRNADDFHYVTGQDLAIENRLGNMSACVFRKSAIDNLKESLFDLLIADWMIGMVICEYGLIAILKTATSVYRIHSKGQYSGIGEVERLSLMNKHLDEYNLYLNFRYNKEFQLHRNRINNEKTIDTRNVSLKEYIPPFVISLLKLITPSYLMRRIRSPR